MSVLQTQQSSSPMLALLFISFRRFANQLYTFNAVTRSNSDSLQPAWRRQNLTFMAPTGEVISELTAAASAPGE